MKRLKKIFKVIIVTIIVMTFTNIRAYASNTLYDLSKVKNEIYNNLKEWNTEFALNYSGENIQEILDSAIDNEDYLERSVSSYKIKIHGKNNRFTINYRTNKYEEEFINNELKRIVNNLIDPKITDEEKVITINNYLIKIFKYDYSLKSDNAYLALTTKSTICQGYAMVAYKMFNMVGIQSRIVSGTVKGRGHAWNLVNINGNWYHLDITNNDNIIRDKYLLVSDKFLISEGFNWNNAKYPVAYNNYYSSPKTFINYNNDNEEDKESYYNGGKWYYKGGVKHYLRYCGKDAVGWLNNDGKWYYFDKDGSMKIGWIFDNGKWYYCYSNGEMAYNTTIEKRKLSNDGSLMN